MVKVSIVVDPNACKTAILICSNSKQTVHTIAGTNIYAAAAFSLRKTRSRVIRIHTDDKELSSLVNTRYGSYKGDDPDIKLIAAECSNRYIEVRVPYDVTDVIMKDELRTKQESSKPKTPPTLDVEFEPEEAVSTPPKINDAPEDEAQDPF